MSAFAAITLESTRLSPVDQKSIVTHSMKPSPIFNLKPTSTFLHHPLHRSTALHLGLSETNGIVAEIIDAVPLPQECITQDSERSDGLWEIYAHESRDTRSLDLQDVIKSSNREVGAGESKGHIW